ncbi:MAG: thiaminase II [Gammaproteobacteria bacterium]|nr:thiaminase II [Gammaproteobacteria bacterium]
MFANFKQDCGGTWPAYVEHSFVRQIGDGTLPEASFRHYLKQDYLFLLHFARAYGLAVFKAQALEDMLQAKAGLAAILDLEIGVHVKYCAGWGLSQEDLQREPEATANLAYTRFLLERGLAGNLTDFHAALTPCVVGYAEIGRHLAKAAGSVEANPYADWIAMYAGEEYQQVARAQIAQLDKLCAQEQGSERHRQLSETFTLATRLEAAFWDMALQCQL